LVRNITKSHSEFSSQPMLYTWCALPENLLRGWLKIPKF